MTLMFLILLFLVIALTLAVVCVAVISESGKEWSYLTKVPFKGKGPKGPTRLIEKVETKYDGDYSMILDVQSKLNLLLGWFEAANQG